MPSKKWQTSRAVTAQSKDRSRGKGKSSLEKRRAKRRTGTPLGSLPPVPASLMHSRALRPISPGPQIRPRSRSLPVLVLDSSTGLLDRKRLRRQTLTPNENISRALFADEMKMKSKDLDTSTKEYKSAKEDKSKEDELVPSSQKSLIDLELKTPDFSSSSSQSVSVPPCVIPESQGSSDGLLGRHELRFGDSKEDDEVIVANTFDVLLPHAAPPRRFIGVDIDETIIMTNHSPSLLLSSVGVLAFQQYVHKRFTDFKTKNQLCRELEKALKDKVLIQPSIASAIRNLQDSGCLVFGLTARYHEMAVSTDRILNALGVNLALTAPFPRKILRDPQNGAMLANGVIYCNGLSKGMVANRFFENVVFRGLTRSEGKPAKGLPESFVFIDDQRPQLDCILKEFHVARNLNLPITCYHYVPDNLRDVCADLDEGVRSQILLKQMETFVQKRIILNNEETLHMLRVVPSTTPVVSKDSSEKALKAERSVGGATDKSCVASSSTALGKLSMWGAGSTRYPRGQESKVSV